MNSRPLSKREIEERLPDELKELTLFVLEKVDSTNSLAKIMCKNSNLEKGVVIAEHQTGGRGRGDHKWESPSGVALYLSIISNPRVEPRRLPAFNMVAAVAASEAIFRETGVKVSLKWPNDLRIAGKKMGGVLLERGNKSSLITGIGLNINNKKPDFSKNLENSATSLFLSSGKTCDRNLIAASVITSFMTWSRALEKSPKKIMDAWKELSETLGKRVEFHENGRSGEGVAFDLDHLGFLMLKDQNGKIIKLTSGAICY